MGGREKYYQLKQEGKIEVKKGTWMAVDGMDGVLFQAATEKELSDFLRGQSKYFSPFRVCHKKRSPPHRA
jgi:hypothetical protein